MNVQSITNNCTSYWIKFVAFYMVVFIVGKLFLKIANYLWFWIVLCVAAFFVVFPASQILMIQDLQQKVELWMSDV